MNLAVKDAQGARGYRVAGSNAGRGNLQRLLGWLGVWLVSIALASAMASNLLAQEVAVVADELPRATTSCTADGSFLQYVGLNSWVCLPSR